MKLLLAAFVALHLTYSAPCPKPHRIDPASSLPELAGFYFGDRDFASAILLATNSRTAEGFPYISHPDNIKDVLNNPGCSPGRSNCRSVCIPEITEAHRLRARYDAYLHAVSDMAIPSPWEIRGNLVEFPPDRPITVTTWIRSGQLSQFTARTTTAAADIWVTLEPHVQQFCRTFAKGHNGDLDQLTLRLEQRFGLPPASSKTTFVRIRLSRPSQDIIFRPCMNPSTSAANCPLGPPDESNLQHASWIYRQYYFSFGQARPSAFPWTSLGYTFDWAPLLHATGGFEFQKFGESEFVIRKGAPIEVIGTQSTAEYCKP